MMVDEMISEALKTIRAEIPDHIVNSGVVTGDIIELEVRPEHVVDVAYFLRDNPKLRGDFLSCVSGIDYLDRLEVAYHIHSLSQRLTIRVKTTLDIDNPVVESLVPVWQGANWHEREAYDLFGIVFSGHPDLRRIMLDDDFAGHPLRKSYPAPRGRAKC